MYIVLLRTMIHRGVEYDELTTLKMQFPFLNLFAHRKYFSYFIADIFDKIE